MEDVVILLLALTIDLTLGEFPACIHPVVWLGKTISLGLRSAPRQGRQAQLIYGTVTVIITMGLFAAAAYFLLSYLKEANTSVYILVGAFLLKSTFSIGELRRAALRVKGFLDDGDLDGARGQVKSLVSRDTGQLDEPQLVSATVESASENISDSFLAPLLYFLLLGVPGAVAYRVVNTFDAMIGYHGRYEYLGKFAARLDDILNFVPARISALLIVAATYLRRKDGKRAWHIMLRDRGKTESPNAGWPMSATAGALGTRLEKVGYYQLGDLGNPLSSPMIHSTVRLVNTVAIMWFSVCLISKAV